MAKKTKTKTRPKPSPAKLASSATTALTRIAKDIQAGIKEVQARIPTSVSSPHVEVLPPEEERRVLGDTIVLGQLGLVELKLTPEEEKVLAEPVPEDRVRVKPTGQVYLPHADYTRWFNRAFGRLGWTVVPVGQPKKAGTSITIPYVLHVHQQPVAFAWGEQEFFENNRDQTYGDAIESTVANAIRRFAKRMGVSLELWDRTWAEEWISRNCIRVRIKPKKDGERPRLMWRRKADSPLPYEMGRSSDEDLETGDYEPAQRREAPPAREEKAHGHHANADDLITQPQRQRLVLIIRNSGRDQEQVTKWLHRKYKLETLKDIRRRDYDRICSAIESPADLPE